MSKEWLIVHYFITGTYMDVGYFFKPDAEAIMKHFSQFAMELRAFHHGVVYIWNGTKLTECGDCP